MDEQKVTAQPSAKPLKMEEKKLKTTSLFVKNALLAHECLTHCGVLLKMKALIIFFLTAI